MKLTETIKKTTVLSLTVLSIISSQVKAREYGVKDEKSYPGSSCVYQQWDLINNRKYNGLGGIDNRVGGATVNVVCPIIRDNAKSRNGIRRVAVFYEDNHPYRFKDVVCYVSSWDAYQNTVQETSSHYRSNRLRSGVGKGSFWMDYPISSSTDSTFYTLNCQLPGTYQNKISSITSYTVVE